jgi:hypothetical protein
MLCHLRFYHAPNAPSDYPEPRARRTGERVNHALLTACQECGHFALSPAMSFNSSDTSSVRSFLLIPIVCIIFTTGCQTTQRHGTSPITGTRWRGVDSDGDFLKCVFESRGRLHYTTPTGDFRNGTWRQRGAQIYMETNKRYSEYFGTIDGPRMSGTAQNVAHGRWTWQMSKVE